MIPVPLSSNTKTGGSEALKKDPALIVETANLALSYWMRARTPAIFSTSKRFRVTAALPPKVVLDISGVNIIPGGELLSKSSVFSYTGSTISQETNINPMAMI
jgi:hypothetical protein